MPNKSIQFTSRGGKEYPGGWIVDPSRDLPIHDPGWHRTGNFPMLTGGIVETPGSPCIIHEVVIPIPRPDGSSNLGRTFCPSSVGLWYTQQPVYNLLEDKNIMCDSYPDDARGIQPSGRSTTCPFYMGWMHRRHRFDEWGVADMPNKRIQFTSRTGKEYPGTFLAGSWVHLAGTQILKVYTGPCKKSKLRPRFIFPSLVGWSNDSIHVGTKSGHRIHIGGWVKIILFLI
jgi:hypothetical protein